MQLCKITYIVYFLIMVHYVCFLPTDYKSSYLMKDIPDDILHTLTKTNMTFNYHHWGLTPTVSEIVMKC